MLMYCFGGIYADLDVLCLERFDQYLDSEQAILGEEPTEHKSLYGNAPVVVSNALLISYPGHPLWKLILQEARSCYKPDAGPLTNTGPGLLTRLYQQFPDRWSINSNVRILNACEWSPVTDRKTNKSQSGFHFISNQCNIQDAKACHIWTHTWVGGDGHTSALDSSKKSNKNQIFVLLFCLLPLLLVLSVFIYLVVKFH
jgi:mannosyltransferase OCH1-like enzyme